MNKKNILFTAGDFAKMHNINKRTLHYYDDIELFSPAYKGENGYRYYTYLQSPQLEMILAMRELKMSIKEIKHYMIHPSAKQFSKILTEKSQNIQDTITHLNALQQLLCLKQANLTLCETDLNRIEIITCPKEYLSLSESITGSYDVGDLAVLVEHARQVKGYKLYNKSYGSMLPVAAIQANNFEGYTCFFTKLSGQPKNKHATVKPAGKYIRAFSKGEWDKLPLVYHRILDFANTNKLILKGYAYEEGLNEMAISSMDEYVTQITIAFEE